MLSKFTDILYWLFSKNLTNTLAKWIVLPHAKGGNFTQATHFNIFLITNLSSFVIKKISSHSHLRDDDNEIKAC